MNAGSTTIQTRTIVSRQLQHQLLLPALLQVRSQICRPHQLVKKPLRRSPRRVLAGEAAGLVASHAGASYYQQNTNPES